MSVRQATYKVLRRVPLHGKVNAEMVRDSVIDYLAVRGEDRRPHHDTILRYLRDMRMGGIRQFVCTSRARSEYMRIREDE